LGVGISTAEPVKTVLAVYSSVLRSLETLPITRTPGRTGEMLSNLVSNVGLTTGRFAAAVQPETKRLRTNVGDRRCIDD
jgi:hypothetical protein